MRQKSDNICKFTAQSSSGELLISNFVLETEARASEPMSIRRNHGVCLVVDGEGLLRAEGIEKKLIRGTVFFTFAGKSFAVENRGRLKYLYISISGDRAEELFGRFAISSFNCVFDGHEGLISFWESGLGKAKEQNTDLIGECVLLYTFSDLCVIEENGGRYLTDHVLKYVEANYTDADLTLASAAQALGYNQKYLSRVFKENMNVTFSEYVKSMRIRHAVFMMEQGVTAIKNVAVLSGYRDPLYFSTVFRQAIGMSPSEYVSKLENH